MSFDIQSLLQETWQDYELVFCYTTANYFDAVFEQSKDSFSVKFIIKPFNKPVKVVEH